MDLTDGNINLLCFRPHPRQLRPQVVIWLAGEAQSEFFRWEQALEESNYEVEEPVRYDDFTVPVAPNFDAFLYMLRREP
jgi:hypothetical protein